MIDEKKITEEALVIKLKEGIEQAVLHIYRATSPHATGALKNKIRVEMTEQGFNIVSDIYYMPYTTEKWISQQWNGRTNPNERWWDNSTEMAMRFLSTVFGKEFKREQ